MNDQQLDRFTVIELAVDELGSWVDANSGDPVLRAACWEVSRWLNRRMIREHADLGARRERMIRIRRQLTELFPLDDTAPAE